MIKNIIIPEKIGNYYLVPERIIGFEITKNQVNAIQIQVNGKLNTLIEKYFEEPLNFEIESTDRISNAISNIIKKIDKYNIIKVCLPSYLIIYKELTFPFTDTDKIKTVLDFEIESSLPFPIEEAVSDFIILNQDLKNKQTTILVAIARKKDIHDLLDNFQKAGILVDSVIVDMIGLYGLFRIIPKYENLKDGLILLDLEFNLTNIAYIQDGQLKLIRSMNQGIYNFAKKISDSLSLDFEKALELINRFGLENSKENHDYNKAINEISYDLISSISYTLNSFKTLLPNFPEIKKIILTGQGADIKGLCSYLTNNLNLNCETFDVNNIFENKNFKIKKRNLPNSAILSLATAYPSFKFNLLQKEFAQTDSVTLKKQLTVFIILFILVFVTLIGFSSKQTGKLQNELNKSKNDAITTLKNTFAITDPSALKNLQLTLQEANSKVNEEEAIWFSFSQTARFSFLKYLQELSSLIDKQAIGLNLKKLTITPEVITLEGEVKDFKGLEILENSLSESKLFSHISIPQETKFTIKITIKKNEETL